jgi:alpha-galactosidase
MEFPGRDSLFWLYLMTLMVPNIVTLVPLYVTFAHGRHPGVEWESCAAGGGRIDLAMLERVQRVWTSDVTDALARQSIQRWTGQLGPVKKWPVVGVSIKGW